MLSALRSPLSALRSQLYALRSPKDREVDEGEQEDKESGKQAKFYFRGLTPFLYSNIYNKVIEWQYPSFHVSN
jgi:hypothetical protein